MLPLPIIPIPIVFFIVPNFGIISGHSGIVMGRRKGGIPFPLFSESSTASTGSILLGMPKIKRKDDESNGCDTCDRIRRAASPELFGLICLF
jgi:hypothetical protein